MTPESGSMNKQNIEPTRRSKRLPFAKLEGLFNPNYQEKSEFTKEKILTEYIILMIYSKKRIIIGLIE